MDLKESLLGKTLEELQEIIGQLGMAKFRAAQLADWLYKKRITSIDEMTNFSKEDRSALADNYNLGRNEPVSFQLSRDGTKKYLFNSGQGGFIEAVYIPDKERATLCISSLIGCKMVWVNLWIIWNLSWPHWR
jgi:23S rRNA (adenine2503-C2)-methyltransferase